MKIRRVAAELFHSDGQTDMTKLNGRFWQYCESAQGEKKGHNSNG